MVGVIGTKSAEDFQVLQNVMPPHWRLIHSEDIIGVEVCGYLKNIYALAAGITKTMKDMEIIENSIAFDYQVAHEMSKIISILGGNPVTAYLPCGMDDYRLSTSVSEEQKIEARQYIDLCIRFRQIAPDNVDSRSVEYQEKLKEFIGTITRRPDCARNVLFGIGLGMGHNEQELSNALGLTFEGKDSLTHIIPLLEKSFPNWRSELPILSILADAIASGSVDTMRLYKLVHLEKFTNAAAYSRRRDEEYGSTCHN